MQYVDYILNHPQTLLTPALVFLGVFVVALGFRRFAYRVLERWARTTSTNLLEALLATTRGPSLLWCVIIGAHVAIGTSEADAQIITYAQKILGALIVVSVSLVAANVAAEAFHHYSSKIDLPATGLTQVIIKIVIIALGVTLALGLLGIDVTPLVAALGVGGLAVALGLQDTLANLFAGIHVLLSKPVRVGDYVKLQSGEEGYVVDIGWRSTRIRQLPNNMVVVPNSQMVQTIITNYYMPEPEMSVLVQVGVHYDSDLEHVEKVTCEVAKAVMDSLECGVKTFDPFIRYHTFGDSSISFSVILRTNEFVGQFLLKHEFVKRLHARYNEEGIVIPFPIRTLDIPPDTLARLGSSS
ncbi:MAG TPA: mechanosensitive ion channel family protein [Vicinamibacteria bacterium]|jgi:small-conductance mechanosensitive channel